MPQQLPESKHFQIVHSPHNIGTRLKPYSVQPKREKTGTSRAMTPMPASADTVEALIPALHEAEREYVANRALVEKYRRAS